MSLEVQAEPVEIPEPTQPVLAINSAAKAQLWRRRRFQVGGAALLILLIAGVATNNFLSQQYSPAGAVRQYLSALQAGDATSVWNATQVAPPSSATTANLTDQAALKAAIANQRDIKSFAVTGTTRLDNSRSSVDVSYETAAGTKLAKFVVERSADSHLALYPGWKVVVTPALLQVVLPHGSSGLSVDGHPIALPGGKSTVAVLPLVHRLDFAATAFFTSQTLSVDALFSSGQIVAYRPALSAVGLAKVKAAVEVAFVTCTQQTAPYRVPDGGCPQSSGRDATATGQWALLGDPTQDITVNFDQELNAVAAGHFQMVFSYQSYGAQRVPDASAYNAPLVFGASDVSVGSIAPATAVPALQRPSGATDEVAKGLVTKAFATCASVSSTYVANCPQQALDVDVSGLHWALSGDPLATATVTYDPSSGLFTVHGSYAMTASYRSFGFSKTQTSLSTAYDAYLLWDGQALQLVTIEGVS
jgi:hypothetical protein